MIVHLKEAGVHNLNGREVNGLAVAPLINDGAKEVRALAVGLIVEGEDVGPHELSAGGGAPINGLGKGVELLKHGSIEPYRFPLLCDA